MAIGVDQLLIGALLLVPDEIEIFFNADAMGKPRLERLGSKKEGSLEDWVAALARKEVSDSSNTKAARIEKRLAKIRRREERKQATEKCKPNTPTFSAKNASVLGGNLTPRGKSVAISASNSSTLLNELSQKLEERVSLINQKNTKLWQKPYSSALPTPKKRRRQRDDCQQPRSSDYGGVGLARASLWISLDDPSWRPKLEEEFSEHISGFFGKQRTNAMKKQLDGTMLWRQLLAEKQGRKKGKQLISDKTINGKKLSTMTPDERAEAIIRAGKI